MGRFTAHKSAQGALNYYLGKLADYFAAGPAFGGRWLGKGAERLDLEGDIERDELKAILNNRHPFDGSKLSQRDRVDRRVGWDVVWSAPKSVSVVFGLNNDLDIVDALRDSVNETLVDMEQDVMTRVNRLGRRQQLAKTHNMIAGVWVHPESRAVDGQMPDPNLHVHSFISNHTWTGERWTAADISNLWRDSQKFYEAAFQNRLAQKLQGLGYQVERSKNNFEIVGVSKSLRDKFSKRTQQIAKKIESGYAETLAAEKGISLTDAKGLVGGLTRAGKGKSFTLDDLQHAWRFQLTTKEGQELDAVANQRQEAVAKETAITAAEAVDYALQHNFEKEAAVRERDVLRDALLYGIEDNTVSDIQTEFANRTLVRQGKDETAIVTNRDLQAEEKSILDFAKLGRGRVKPLYSDYQIEKEWLSDEQKQAVLGILHSPDRLQVLRGVAGVGKSTLLEEVVPAMTKAGKSVAIMAPTQKATQNLVDDGFGKATTMQSFLLDERAQASINKGVIVVDEAGLIDNSQFAALINVAKNQDARILAVGDSRQHAPVGRGHPLKLIEQKSGITPKLVTQIRRQEDLAFRKSVEHLSRGEVLEGLQGLREQNRVHEIADESRDNTLAEEFANAALHYKPNELLAIAATHAERRKINSAIREKLRERKVIKGMDHEFTTLTSKPLSAAERSDPLNFEPGDVISYHTKAQGGIETGDQFMVTETANGKVKAGSREIDLTTAKSFAVYRPETANYAKGDVIRLTRGRKAEGEQKKLNNGSLHTIKSIRKGVVTLDNDEKLPASFRFFDHGRVITSHVSQGTTVKRAFVAASSLSFPASSPEQMYVSASRAKKQVDIYTDSIEGLERAVSRIRPKALASDVMPEAPSKKETLASKFGRIRMIAQQYVTKQLQRFHDAFPARSPEPDLER